MPIPTEIPDVRAALLAYELPPHPQGVIVYDWDKAADDLLAAQGKASIVSQVVDILGALKGQVAHLDQAGAELLAGACYLIAAHAWHGMGVEALGVRDTALARLVALGEG